MRVTDLGQFLWPDASQGRIPQTVLGIDSSNPLAANLWVAMQIPGYNNQAIDAVTGLPLGQNLGNDFNYAVAPNGGAALLSRNSVSYQYSARKTLNPPGYTAIAFITPKTTTGSTGTAVITSYASGWNIGSICLGDGTNARFSATFYNGTTTNRLSASSNYVLGQRYCVAVQSDGVNAILWINGVIVASNTSSWAMQGQNPQTPYIGSIAGLIGGDYMIDGWFVWPSLIPADSVIQVSTNPGQLFATPEVVFPRGTVYSVPVAKPTLPVAPVLPSIYHYGLMSTPAVGSGLPGLPVRGRVAPPTQPSNSFIRPADWLPLPVISATTEKIVFLWPIFAINDATQNNTITFTAAGNFNVDWGDGTNTNYSSGATTSHSYTWSTISSSTLTSQGFRQVIVTVTPQAGAHLTSFTFPYVSFYPYGSQTNASWMLDIAINAPNLTTLNSGSQPYSITFGLLQSIYLGANAVTSLAQFCSNMPVLHSATIYAPAATTLSQCFQSCPSLTDVRLFQTDLCTDFSSLFSGCKSLQSVPLFNTAAGQSFNSMFSSCSLLKSVPHFVTTNGTDFGYMFSNCSSLPSVPLLDTSNGTNFIETFAFCNLLVTVPAFNFSNATSLYATFNSCYSLTSIPIFNMPPPTGMLNMGSMFQSCYSLSSVPLLDTSGCTSMVYTFSGCISLQTVPLFNTWRVTSFYGMFQSCCSLLSVPLFDMTSATELGFMFQSCESLKTIPAFNTSSVQDVQSMFSNCPSLVTIPLLDFSNVDQTYNMFGNCKSLASIPALNMVNSTGGSADLGLGYQGSLTSVGILNMTESLSVVYCAMSASDLNTLFTNLGMADTSLSATITITGNPGAGSCNQSIATAKGWIVTN